MTSIVNKVVETYTYVFTDLADPRTNGFFLVGSPWPILALSGLYLYICTSLGPRYMKTRQPYNLKTVVLLYNMFQVVMSSYIFYEGVIYMSSENFSFKCDPIDYSDDPRAMRAVNGVWWYFFSKITEFLDTIFFVLRKKNNQISFLHVYHHSMMAVMTWVGIKYLPGGHGILMGTLNSFVHVVMYTYYLIAGLGPQYQKYIWWKKHVTVLQLTQFVIVLIHNLTALFSDCSFPKIPNVLMCCNAILFINLFGKFFYASYIKGSTANGTAKSKSVRNSTVKTESVTNGTVKTESVTNGTVKTESVTNGTVTNGIVKTKSVTNGTVKNGIYTNGSTHKRILSENGTHKNGVSLNEKHKDV